MVNPRLRDYLMLVVAPALAAALVMFAAVGLGFGVVAWDLVIGYLAGGGQFQPVDPFWTWDSLRAVLNVGMVAAIAFAAVVAALVGWRLIPRMAYQIPSQSGRNPSDYIRLAILPVAVLVAAGLIFGLLSWLRVFTMEIALTVLLAAGVVSLVLTLAVVAVFFDWHKLADPKAALGLPEGSVRAVIALSLILIFAILSVFTLNTFEPPSTFSRGLTEEQVEQLDEARILQIDRRLETAFVGEQPTVITVFDVRMAGLPSEARDDLSRQLITTVGTLVAAIAAFYFGANSVTTAQQAISGKRSPLRVLSVQPSAIARTEAGYSPITVTTDSRVPGEYTAEVIGDDTGTVDELEAGIFKYVPGAPGDRPGVRIARTDNPRASKDVYVRPPGPLPNSGPEEPTDEAAGTEGDGPVNGATGVARDSESSDAAPQRPASGSKQPARTRRTPKPE